MTIKNWIENYRRSIHPVIKEVLLADLPDWKFTGGSIKRNDDSFFQVKAIRPDRKAKSLKESPIINQSELGILGFVISGKPGNQKILLHAKSEPGNIGLTQIGPTVQATESNYKVKHKGKKQKYIEYFLDDNYPKIVSIKQSEQGNSFYNKYNINVIVNVPEDEILIDEEKFRFFDFDEVREKITDDYLFNTDFKSVSCNMLETVLQLKRSLSETGKKIHNSYHNNLSTGIEDIVTSLENSRKKNNFSSEFFRLDELKGWKIKENGIIPDNPDEIGFKYFDITLIDREVKHWNQPLIYKDKNESIILLCFEKNNELQFIFRERIEIGFTNNVQLGPTVQVDEGEDPDIIFDNPKKLNEFSQSEEGGRFYRVISKYEIIQIDNINQFIHDQPYYILDVHQICRLLNISGIFTNETRSLISSLLKLSL